jgi:hypothetical protein
MKKLVLTSVCTLALTGAAFSQGTVIWGSVAPPSFTAYTNSTVDSFITPTGTLPAGGATAKASDAAGGFYYELLYNTASTEQNAPTTLTALATWNDSGLEAENSAATPGAITTLGQNTAAPVTGSSSGVDYSLMLVGWSANLGTSWSAVSSILNSPAQLAAIAAASPTYFGTSSIGYLPLNPGNPGAVIFGTAAGEIDSPTTELNLITVPEPTTIALGVMGAASLLAFRRKKA